MPHHSGEEKAGTEFGFFIPLIAGGMLASYNPKLGMGAGVLTLAVAAGWKKNWAWWVVGSVVLVIGLFFYFTQDEKSSDSIGSGEDA